MRVKKNRLFFHGSKVVRIGHNWPAVFRSHHFRGVAALGGAGVPISVGSPYPSLVGSICAMCMLCSLLIALGRAGIPAQNIQRGTNKTNPHNHMSASPPSHEPAKKHFSNVLISRPCSAIISSPHVMCSFPPLSGIKEIAIRWRSGWLQSAHCPPPSPEKFGGFGAEIYPLPEE